MKPSKQTKLAIGMLLLHTLGYLVFETRGTIVHFRREPWERHAIYHGVAGLFYQHALLASVVYLAWFPLRQGQKWAWWGIMMIGLAMHGGQVLSDAITRGGLRKVEVAQGSGRFFYLVAIAELILYGVALVLSFRHVYPAATDEEERNQRDGRSGVVERTTAA